MVAGLSVAGARIWWHFEMGLILGITGGLSCQAPRAMLILLCSLIKGRGDSALQLLRDSEIRWH